MNKHDFKIKGYIIEVRYCFQGNEEDFWTNWLVHYNNKLYSNKDAAIEALSYTKEYLGVGSETRIKPLYEINYERKQ